jgi:uncharacterized protein
MNEFVEKLLMEASELLTDAEVLLKAERWNAAVSRSYYAMFHAARAALLQLNVETYTHQGVNTQFAKHYIKTGIFDKSLSFAFSKMLEMRMISDYEIGFNAKRQDAEYAYSEAGMFIDTIKKHLRNAS